MYNSSLTRWMYRGQRPNAIARALNGVSTWPVVSRINAHYGMVTLEVTGRTSGRAIALPLVMVTLDGQRYLVSMLGENVQWVNNVRAASGHATLRSVGRQPILLEEVPASQRAPILKLYLAKAPGARPHIPVDKDAPLSEFEKIASSYPVFRITAPSATPSAGSAVARTQPALVASHPGAASQSHNMSARPPIDPLYMLAESDTLPADLAPRTVARGRAAKEDAAMNVNDLQAANGRRVGVRLHDLRGSTVVASGISLTPIARQLAIWWPGGGWTYTWPSAIEYPAKQRIRRVRITPIRQLTWAALAIGVIVALAGASALLAQSLKRENRTDQDKESVVNRTNGASHTQRARVMKRRSAS